MISALGDSCTDVLTVPPSEFSSVILMLTLKHEFVTDGLEARSDPVCSLHVYACTRMDFVVKEETCV